MDSQLDMFAIVSPGFETECARELTALKVAAVEPCKGGVSFRGSREDMQRANLMLRTATRVLVRIAEFRCRDFPQLFRRCRDLPWGRYIRPGTPLEVAVTAQRSRLIHSDRIEETVKEAVAKALGVAAAQGEFVQRLQVRLQDDTCTVSIDSSGELLHRRGYRSEAGAAPLRETLAAGILLKLGWEGREPLVDPMCGSGSFLVEGALLAGGHPPGGQRSFAFMHWPKFRPGGWQALLREVSVAEVPLRLHGADIDREVLARAERNAERAGVGGQIAWHQGGFSGLEAPEGPGLVVCNPPYGERLGQGDDLTGLYTEFGAWLRERFVGWRYAFICPNPELARATGLTCRSLLQFSNGGLPVDLYAGDLSRA